MTLIYDRNNKLLCLIMVIKCIELFDPEAYGLVSILSNNVFLWSKAVTLTFDLDKQ
jgi:hypothetical protein